MKRAISHLSFLGLLSFLSAIAFPTGIRAQDPWFGGAFYERHFFDGSAEAWTDWETVRGLFLRQFDSGAFGVEATYEDRFGTRDETVAADAYLNLWTGSYANLRIRAAHDAEIVPYSDWRLEVFEGLAGGWEISGSAWLMNVPGPNVSVFGFGLGRYVEAWYVRAIGNVAESAGTRSGGGYLSARRFFEDDGRQFVEMSAGSGGEAVVVGAGPILEVRDTWFAQATLQRFFWNTFGLNVSAGVHDFEGIPVRRRLTLGLITRF